MAAPNYQYAIQSMKTGGIGVTDLAAILGMTEDDVENRLIHLSPISGSQRRTRVYNFASAIGMFVSTEESTGGMTEAEIEVAIRKMKPSQLPPALSLEFWKAQQAKQKFEEDKGDLVRKDKVIYAFAATFKAIRETFLLIEDNLDQMTALTPHQRQLVRGFVDGSLVSAKEATAEQMAVKLAELDRDEE